MIQKQAVPINFSQGLDTKTDPKQVQLGKFLTLQNSVFDKGGLLKKRNGYGTLSPLPDSSSTYLTTFNSNLTAIGSSISAYSAGSQTWVSKGSITPMSVSTLPLIRNTVNQTQADSVTAPNGFACTIYTEVNGNSTSYKYVVADSVTGQNITAPAVIPVASGTVTGAPRVFLLGSHFIMVFTNLIGGTYHLQYITINTAVPTSVGANTDIASSYIPTSTLSWDAVVVGTNLYVAYNTTAGGQSVKVTYLTAGLVLVTPKTFAGSIATIMSICADMTTPQNPQIYICFYDTASTTGSIIVLDQNLNTVIAPVVIDLSAVGTALNITCVAQNGTATIFVEVTSSYSYDSAIPSHYIQAITVTPVPTPFTSVFGSGAAFITPSSLTGLSTGMFLVDNTTPANIAVGTQIAISGPVLLLSHNTAGASASSPGDTMGAAAVATHIVIGSVGLASKAFIIDGQIYFLAAYQSDYQPSYFLVNGSISTPASPVVVGKLAYSNGGGYLTTGLPNVTVDGSKATMPYRYKDLIAAVNKDTAVAAYTQVAGIYSQTGINLGSFAFGTQGLDAAEIGSNLNLSGGFLWMYDGYLPVENNFFLWPDNVEVSTSASAVTPTGNVTNGSNTIVNVSSMTGVGIGAKITGTGIPANQTITSVTASTITFGPLVATATNTGVTLTITGQIDVAQEYYYQATYEWTDNQGNAFRSAPSIPVTVTTTGTTSTNTIHVPTLRLTYKTANPVKIVVYRWSAAQEEYFQVTSLTQPTLNDTTVNQVTIVDSLSDATILGNNILYTTGGMVENVNGPASNLMTLFDDRLWLVDAEDPNLLWYSKQVIESTPVEMSDLLTFYVAPTTGSQGSTGPITALSVMDDKLIIFKQNAIYYVNGSGPDNTGANNQYSQPIFVTSTVGCSNQNSIVFMPGGLMFQSDKGIWLLGRGMDTSYVGAPVEEFNSSLVQSAVNVPLNNQVRFTLDTGQTLMLDYYYDQWGTFVGVPAISSCVYQSLHTFINQYGQVYQETPGKYLDGSNPVNMLFTTNWIKLADLQGYQRAYFFYLLGQYFSPHKLNLSIAYDYNPSPSQVTLISPTNYSSATASAFGVPSPFGSPSDVEQWRVFLTKQRCMAFQITLQEVYDGSFGVPAGAGLSLSGLNIVAGFKKGFRPIGSSHSAGGRS